MDKERTWHDFLLQAQWLVEKNMVEDADEVELAKKLFERWKSKNDK